MIDLDQLISELSQRGIGWEVTMLLACLAAAYGICWLTGRHRAPDSVLFGRHLVDGVLFPLLALAFTYTARVWLGGLLFDRTGSYDLVWWIAIALGVLAALANLPIREHPLQRAQAQAA